ncbi:hypothetical protein HFP15_19280 [Amycolatopsis sp. K13G38]|uniref:DUF2090 domain-containing protein n=1 Tax=Amycolatopsis acididurans TaxID=2724524 RepID=A0ABX1J5K0_9PSEU|nr:hypothetical protein [Amycolatopsis acididurans]NKQ55028.1 hypothetical protein [Amycolatopsis acididurans]
MTGHEDVLSFPSPSGERLRAAASWDGVYCLLALDHRDAMRNAFARAGLDGVDEEKMLQVKGRIADTLTSRASGILLDPAALERCRPKDAGVLMPLEAQGYEPFAGGRLTRLEHTVAELAELGADGCKLLIYYRYDHRETAWRQRELVHRAVADCRQHRLPLVLEPLLYRLEGETSHPHPDLIVGAARDLAGIGADLLKLPFPGRREACEQVSELADWVLLGGSDTDRDTFAEQLVIATSAGACGFIAGRPIWGGALGLDEAEQAKWLAEDALPYFDRLTDIAHGRTIA